MTIGSRTWVRTLWASPTARTLGLTLAVVGVAGAALPSLAAAPIAGQPFALPWWVMAIAFASSEAGVFHLEIYRDAHSFSFSEVPLIVALFFCSPMTLVVGRLLGETISLLVQERLAPLKLALNLSTFLAECVAAFMVFHLVAGNQNPLHATTWLAAFLAVAAADLVSILTVSLAIMWHGGHPRWQHLAIAGAVTLVINTSLALVASILLWVNPAAAALLLVLGVVLVCAYRGYARLVQRYSSLHLLYDFTRMVSDSVKAEAVMEAMLGQARRLLRATTAEIMLVEPGNRTLRWRMDDSEIVVASGALTDDEDGTAALRAAVIEQGEPRLIPRSSKTDADHLALARLAVRDCIIAPLRSPSGALGTILVANRLGEVSTFDKADLKLFETLANHAAVALENGRLIDQLRQEAAEREHEAFHDSLTGLPNRAMFHQRVAEAIARGHAGQRLAVMLMDLDRFKDVNDTLGHHSGDLLLCEVASRLRGAGLRDATIARLGGDEFAILAGTVRTDADLEAVAYRVSNTFAEPVVIDDLALEVRGSIGIALWPEHGLDPSTLLKRADVAMYWAKAAEDPVAVYDAGRDHNTPRRLSLAGELRQAIDENRLVVHFQPKANVSDGKVIGAEALVRWNHPVHGFVSPEEFIPLAETTGGIHSLTSFVLREALQQCRRWQDANHNIGVAVNLAVRNLRDGGLPDEIAALLAETGIAARNLTLEITESSIMRDTKRSTRILDELSELGVELAIDDFGTGYSSLSYLQQLPVHEIKIDKSFVLSLATSPNDATIVRSIIELGHNLNLGVVAEGVENGPTWDRLRAMQCDTLQGYFLSRPMPADQMMEWLETRRGRAIAVGSRRFVRDNADPVDVLTEVTTPLG